MSFRDALHVAAAIGLTLCAASANACLPPLPVPQLPGESQADFEERNRVATMAEDAEGTRLSQERSFDAAQAVFIGRVERHRTVEIDGRDGGEVTVKPFGPIKGALPRQMVTLRDSIASDCGMLGAGSAPSLPAGSWVFVFDRITEGDQVHSEGYAAMQARDMRLLKALRDYGAAHPATPPPPSGRR